MPGWFVKDDLFLLLNSTLDVHEAATTSWLGGFYRPLPRLLYGLQFEAFGLAAWPYRCVSLLLHLLGTSMVFAVSRQWGLSRHDAGLAALLFGVHPGVTESVVWISGQMALLSGVAMICTVAASLRAASAQSRFHATVPVALGTAVSVLSYESGVVTPLVCTVVLLGRLPRSGFRGARQTVLASFAVVGFYLVLRGSVTSVADGPYQIALNATRVLVNVGYYGYLALGGTAVGGRLAAYQGLPSLGGNDLFWVFPPLLLAIGAIACLLHRIRRDTTAIAGPSMAVALAWVSATLLTALLLEARPRRLLYPALVPLTVWGMSRLRTLSPNDYRAPLTALLLLTACVTTSARAYDWQRAGMVERGAVDWLAARFDGGCQTILIDVPNQLGDALFFHTHSAQAWLRLKGRGEVRVRHRYEIGAPQPANLPGCAFVLDRQGHWQSATGDSIAYRAGSNWFREVP